MFSNTAYEALYQMLGLGLHAKFIELITGETFFKGLVLLIFGALFFFTALKFISKHLPGSLVERKHIPLSKMLKVIACLFLGLTILRVGQFTDVKDYQGKNWADNPYIQSQTQEAESQYKVSIVFNLLSRTAEELTSLIARVVDGLFAKGSSQLTAPNMFYKAIMYAGSSTIEDSELRDQIKFYADECFTKVIPSLNNFKERSAIDGFYRASEAIDKELSEVTLEIGNDTITDCLEVKNDTVQKLNAYASIQTKGISERIPWEASMVYSYGGKLDPSYYQHYVASQALANFYADQSEGRLGIHKGAEAMGNTGYTFQVLSQFFSWDGFLGTIGFRELQGASESAKKAQEFSEHLSRAPHVAGFVRMILVAIFPWLMFFVVAGRWRVLLVWFWIYFSVLLWTPLWTLLYHIMLGISLSSETMMAFGQMADGISMYSSSIVSHRMYYMYSIYSWLQLLVATLTTGSAFMFLKPILGQHQTESAPEFMGTAQNVAGTGVDVATAGSVSGAAKAIL